jgi:hypothetical protein
MHYQRWKAHGDPFAVKKTPSPAIDWIRANAGYAGDECLTWPFSIGADGYGRAHYPGTAKLTIASRLMCIVAHGEPPSPKHEAAHSCGRGKSACTNPRHLYWATPTINHADKILHNTTNRGERQWRAKLSEADVRQIRSLIGTMTNAAIAKRFDVDQSHISEIKHRRAWAWLD